MPPIALVGFNRRLAGMTLLVVGLGFASHVCAAPPVHSAFDGDAEGWTVTDLNCNNYANVLSTHGVMWQATGGNPGAYISAVDPSNNCFFFNAPAAFLGDQSNRVGGSLQFSVRTDLNNWTPGSIMVLIGNGGQVLVHDFAQPGENVWETYRVPLHHSVFRFNTAGGPTVSEAQFAAVMGDLQALRISGEFGSVVKERSDLDSVCMRSGNCLADLTCSGVIDVSDLLQLLAAWGPCNDCPADLTGDGVVDVSDLLELLASWGACPE